MTNIFKLPILKKIEAEREAKLDLDKRILIKLEDFLELKKVAPRTRMNSFTGKEMCDHHGNTYKRYRNFWDNFIRKYKKFDHHAVVEWLRDHLASGHKAATYNSGLTIMKQFSDYLMDMGIIKEKVIHPRYFKYMKLDDQVNYPVVDPKDLKFLLSCDSDKKILNYIKFALATGLRAQELVDIPKFDFSEEGNCMTVVGKGRNRRVLHLNLRLQVMRSKILADPINTTNYLNKLLKRFLKSRNLTVYSFHSFRATYASNLYDTGVKIERIARILGHKSIDTTKKYIKTLRNNQPVELINPYDCLK